MENATKALLIGAGVLFAVVIISIAIVAYQNISGFYQSKQSNLTQEQLAAFNTEYGAYERDLTGFELVGLINKITDFNERNPEEDGYKPMAIQVEITESSSYNGELFTAGTYTGKNNDSSRNSIITKISNMKNLEIKYTAAVLSKLVANSRYADMTGDEIKNIVRKGSIPKIDELKEYEDYVAFKRAKFEYVSDEYTNDQITKLYYKSK